MDLSSGAAAHALIVLCTCPDEASAARLAEAAVEGGHAACVNRVPGLLSTFLWQGRVERESEVLLLAKTTPAAYPALEACWSALHPYELPEVIAVDVTTGSAAYLEWIESCVTS